MNRQQLLEKYEIEFSGGMVLCRPLEGVVISRLQLKMMQSYNMESILPCSIIKWDESDKLVYLLHNKLSLKEQMASLSKDQCIYMMLRLLENLNRIEQSGYLFPGNLLLDEEFIFYDAAAQKIDILYLPEELKEEYGIGSQSGEVAKSLSALARKTRLGDVFEWKQCELYFGRQHMSMEGMHIYFLDRFPGVNASKGNGANLKRVRDVVLQNAAVELRMPIGKGECLMGRSNIYALSRFSTISGRHCKLYEKDGKAYVVDLGSTNGTFLNERQLKKDVEEELQEGNYLALSNLKFKVHLEWEI